MVVLRQFPDQHRAAITAHLRPVVDSFVDAENTAEGLIPVVAHFDDNAQLALEIERTSSGNVVLYLPGAPNPWSGSVISMPERRVERLNMKTHEAIKMIRLLGKGSARFAESRA